MSKGQEERLKDRFDEIEREIMYGKHTPASVFTQMRTAAMYIKQAPAEQSDIPLGAIENGRAFADRLETYGFEYEGGNLVMCSDWQEFRRCFEHLASWASEQAPAEQEPVGWFTEDHCTDKSATTYDPVVAERWKAKGWPVWNLYTTPIAAEPAPAQDERNPTPTDYLAARSALESCDWSNVPIGTKAILGRAVDLLWLAAQARPAQTEQQLEQSELVTIHRWILERFLEVDEAMDERGRTIENLAKYDMAVGRIRRALSAPIAQTAPQPCSDTLIKGAKALLVLDEKGSLAPHGIGGLAREVIEKLIAGVEQAAPQPEHIATDNSKALINALERVKLNSEEAKHHSASGVAYWNNAVNACILALAKHGEASE